MAEQAKPLDLDAVLGEIDAKSTEESNNVSVKLVPESGAVPFTDNKDFLLMCSLRAPFHEVEHRAPVKIVCVIDQSSSMSGDRMRLVKNSLKFIIQNLTKEDSLAIVSYDTDVKKPMDFTIMDQTGKVKANRIVGEIRAHGRTNLVGGLIKGIEVMAEETAQGEVRSIMLFTDGEANVGYTTPQDVVRATVDTKFASKSPDSNHYRNKPRRSSKEKPMQELKDALEILFANCKEFFENAQYKEAAELQPKINLLKSEIQKRLTGREEPWRQSLAVGTKIIAESNEQPFLSVIKEILEDDMILVGFDGWGTRYDEKFDIGSDRIKPFVAPKYEANRKLTSTLNTFGFGQDHADELLKAISDHGEGLYYYIEPGNIAEAFADCLGGLLSTVGEKVTIKFEMLQPEGTEGAEFAKVVNKDLQEKTKIVVDKEIVTVDLGDIQSEEARDILFKVKLPKLNRPMEKCPLVQVTITYKNVITQLEETTVTKLDIWRPDGEECKDPEVNLELNRHSNRLRAADAMELANSLQGRDLKQARTIIKTAMDEIRASPTGNEELGKELLEELQECLEGLRSYESYSSFGSKTMSSHSRAHYKQRMTRPTSNVQKRYSNRTKARFKTAISSRPDLYK